MTKPLRALILGAGYAGQGHAMALRSAGVDIVAMSSRTEAVGAPIAGKLGIPEYGTDWRVLMEDLRPDIVAVGTPGGTHREMIEAAIDCGCHVFADKPLATTAEDARLLYERARTAGIKTAYAASYWYQPQAYFAREMVEDGTLGKIVEVECCSHFGWPALMPFGWPHRLATGGGRLNNNFPHKLAIAQHVIGGEILSVMGESRIDLPKVPISSDVHDFREFARRAMTPADAAKYQWADVDSDWAYTALLRIGDPQADIREAASVTFRHSALRHGWNEDYIAIYGDKGTLHVEGAYMQGGLFLRSDRPGWEELAIPLHIRDRLPEIEDNTDRNWICLARDFVADIRGEAVPRYLNFRDGWIYQEVIDTVRSNSCWKPVPR